jgi:hypothetical protein
MGSCRVSYQIIYDPRRWVRSDSTDVTIVLPIAAGGTGNTSGTATVNADLTGPITSSGNATSIASQTGTGTTFVMSASPTLTGVETVVSSDNTAATNIIRARSNNLTATTSLTYTGVDTSNTTPSNAAMILTINGVEFLRGVPSGKAIFAGVINLKGYTVATLPVGAVGDRAYVTDALAPAYGAVVVGGGAVTVPVFYNGAAWITA